jgi:NDP-sugar pyrophosphorylase family protein
MDFVADRRLCPGREEHVVVKAFILAAGEGSRLRPLTLTRPKPMLDIAGKPLLERIILWLRHYGVTEIAINLNYMPHTITGHFGNGSDLGVGLTYSNEDRLLGAAGALKKVESWLDESFVVMYGDILTNLDLGRILEFHSRAAGGERRVTSVVYEVPNPTECGIVQLGAGNRIMRLIEKPAPHQVFSNLALAGVLVMEPAVLSHIPADTFHDIGHDLLPKLLAEEWPIYGMALVPGEHLIDIGTPEKYALAQKFGMP